MRIAAIFPAAARERISIREHTGKRFGTRDQLVDSRYNSGAIDVDNMIALDDEVNWQHGVCSFRLGGQVQYHVALGLTGEMK